MDSIINVPIESVIALTADKAVNLMRDIFRSECRYANLGPSALTISSTLTTPDGGIDSQIKTPKNHIVPKDCIFRNGLTGFQIKSGASFKPWVISNIQKELLISAETLKSEVEQLIKNNGYYILICSGYDLTPEQRNKAKRSIAKVIAEKGYKCCKDKVDVYGASQIAEFAERYPGVACQLTFDPIQEALLVKEWQQEVHMSNKFDASPEQQSVIETIRENIFGNIIHTRILGEPGIGKTRIVLEAVKEKNIAPYTLYIEHGDQFSQTKLFRQFLKNDIRTPLVLVIDELSESMMIDIWRHLKKRCGQFKIITLDHGGDECHDENIERIEAPRLSDEQIKIILESVVGKTHDLDRWASLCGGSPRVALAVADNLLTNPKDILKSPSTVALWSRFLHGYENQNEEFARRVDCVTQHLALFNRFGYEHPVEKEAEYIEGMIASKNPSIGSAQFQEIVRTLRARKVLQGSKTLFFVPKALHIYLWRKYWENYGRTFNFNIIFSSMPDSLHSWFMSMFKYADGQEIAHVIDEILRIDGYYAHSDSITSMKGVKFLYVLAEVNPKNVLILLESIIGKLSDKELFELKNTRQCIVWTLEKIAVWKQYVVRVIRIMRRLAVNENATNSNNATGTLVNLFSIGIESATTEASPEVRLPALVEILRSSNVKERSLGLKIIDNALNMRLSGFRIIGPERQGLKPRADLWKPKTYGQLWEAYRSYFQILIDETRSWPVELRHEVCQSLLKAVKQQIEIPKCTEMAFSVLDILLSDAHMQPSLLNDFFWKWQEYERNDKNTEISYRIKKLEMKYTRHSFVSRFQRYVIDVDFMEIDEDFRERHQKKKNRSILLIESLASRIVKFPDILSEISHLLAPKKECPGLWKFGEALGSQDDKRNLLSPLVEIALSTKHSHCLCGYINSVCNSNPSLYQSIVKSLLTSKNSAWIGVQCVLVREYDDALFDLCFEALIKKWVNPFQLKVLTILRKIKTIPSDKLHAILCLLRERGDLLSLRLLLDFLENIDFDAESKFDSAFVFEIINCTIPCSRSMDADYGYDWKNVCLKLLEWNVNFAIPLLDKLLVAMNENDDISSHSYVCQISDEIVLRFPDASWVLIKDNFLNDTMNFGVYYWFKSEYISFQDAVKRSAITYIPYDKILEWISENPNQRAKIIARLAPPSLNDEEGGKLTRVLLEKYSNLRGVASGICATFHSGGWSGDASKHMMRKRDKLRQWLVAGFSPEVNRWIDNEIDHLDSQIEIEIMHEERDRFDD